MPPSGVRTFPAASVTSRAASSPSTSHPSRRSFFSWPGSPGPNGSGGSNGSNKPHTEPVSGKTDDSEASTNTETTPAPSRSRTRGSAAAAAAAEKTRQAKKPATASLPPIKLPRSFYTKNWFPYHRDFHPVIAQPQIPDAIKWDAKRQRVSRLFDHHSSTNYPDKRTRSVEHFFERALKPLLEWNSTQWQLYDDFVKRGATQRETVEQMRQLLRLGDKMVATAWPYADALYPARKPEYEYRERPWWWWLVHGKPGPVPGLVSQPRLSDMIHALNDDPRIDCSLAHIVPDLSTTSLAHLSSSILRDLHLKAPSTFDPKTSKRQIPILTLSGYSGKAVAQSAVASIAMTTRADLLTLDAFSLSQIVGANVGQDWTFNRGSLSMLGFRAAELGGKLARDPDTSVPAADEDDVADSDGPRITTAQLEEELQKIKQGGYECFSKWDRLKIDKLLNHMIQRKGYWDEGDPRAHKAKPRFIIHIHDYVEMSMTLEGAWLIGRIRALADAAWKNGETITVVGTSSTSQPSGEYQSMVQDLAVEDFVVSKRIDPASADKATLKECTVPGAERVDSLEKMDMLVENAENLERMMCALNPDDAEFSNKLHLDSTKIETFPGCRLLYESILPAPELYNMALRNHDPFIGPGVDLAQPLLDRIGLLNLRDFTNSSDGLDQRNTKLDPGKDNQGPGSSDPQAPKLTEYEKRVSSGQIKREDLKVSFGDVHVPKETVSALKLLTSLTLTRPDAFSYGVLAADKIPGCLLYGPPGTGKTMLAKAVAKDSGANMLEISGAVLNDKYVGEGEKLVRAVFTLAKKLAPCVVFLDEADALLASRSLFTRVSHRELLNQFLKEWDGLKESSAFIMVATNRPFDLDDAVLRRLPRKILVDLPVAEDRTAIMNLLLRGETLDASVSIPSLAQRTPFYSGSDLKNVCVAAAMSAVEEENEAAAAHTGSEAYKYPEKRTLRADHFEKALKQIPASISEDMPSLKQIRKFDQEYGRRRTKGKKGMGFGVLPETGVDTREAMIRQEKRP